MPRIRTIKPEFWRNRQLANLPEFTRLVAIALLNIADDEGFFESDAMLIRGDVFPYLEDYRNITVALRELSCIGYITIRDTTQKGAIGYIENFSKHQVISNKSKSKLRQFYEETLENTELHGDYSNATVTLHGDSIPEQGTGNMEKEVEKEKETPPESPKGEIVVEKRKRTSDSGYDANTYRFSGHLDTPEVHDAFQRYVAMRKAKGKRDRATLGACEQIERDFQNYSAADLVTALGRSIVSSWNGVFPPGKSTKNAKPQRERIDLSTITDREITIDDIVNNF
jgi:hypothetical protein